MIDAEFRSEEKFFKLALGYNSEDEKGKVDSCVETVISGHSCVDKPEMYTTSVGNSREVLVIEYHNSDKRQFGDVFEKIMKSLDIKACA